MEEEGFFGYDEDEVAEPRYEDDAWDGEGLIHELEPSGEEEYEVPFQEYSAVEEIEEDGLQIGLDYATLQSVSAMPFQTNLPGMRAAQSAMRTPAAKISSSLEGEIETITRSKSSKIREAALEMSRKIDSSYLAFCHVPTMATAIVFLSERRTIDDAPASFWKKASKEAGGTIPDTVRYIRLLQRLRVGDK